MSHSDTVPHATMVALPSIPDELLPLDGMSTPLSPLSTRSNAASSNVSTPEERLRRGQCQCCGQRLFRRWFGQRRPLSIAGKVERGQCLVCCTAASTSTGSETTSDRSTTVEAVSPGDSGRMNATLAPRYYGLLNEYGERTGEGMLEWPNGDVYRGDFWNGLRHGHGTLSFGDGSDYVGDWACNLFDGQGTRRYANGDLYIGQWRQGQRCGQGRLYFGNGDLHIGGWRDSVQHGPGRYFYARGVVFAGDFVRGQRHGLGRVQLPNGELQLHVYHNNRRVGDGLAWNRARTKAWRLTAGGARQRIATAEAVSAQYAMEAAAEELNVVL